MAKEDGKQAALPPSKGRRLSLRTLLKQIRTRVFTVKNAVLPRTSNVSAVTIVTIATIVTIIAFVLLFRFLTQSGGHHGWPHPFSLTDNQQQVNNNRSKFQLRHPEFDEPPTHFEPPSLFSPERCVRQFDQADVLQRSLSSSPSAKQSLYVSIAFGIQASGETVKLLPRLLSRIHSSRNMYIIHIDSKTSLDEIKQFRNHVKSIPAYSNVEIIPSEMLTYKGISTVLNSLTLMSRALQLHSTWSFYINLSAGDYPLTTPDALSSLLSRPNAPPGALNFASFFPRSEWHPYSFRVNHMFWDPAESGQQSAKAKLFHMSGQRLHPLEPHRAYTFTKAEAWTILSRRFVIFLTRSSFAKRMLLAHTHVLSVSEHFTTDTLFNHPVWRATVVPEAFRKVVWYYRGRRAGQHPYKLDAFANKHQWFSFWSFLTDSTAIFARKFSIPDSPLMDRVDLEISGAGINERYPKFEFFRKARRQHFERLVQRFDHLTQETLRQQNYSWSSTAYPDLLP